MYEKDPYHPPHAPDVKETKEILREYNTAVLLSGPDGKKITEIAVRLEGEAYHMGYYKAFAMTALSFFRFFTIWVPPVVDVSVRKNPFHNSVPRWFFIFQDLFGSIFRYLCLDLAKWWNPCVRARRTESLFRRWEDSPEIVLEINALSEKIK